MLKGRTHCVLFFVCLLFFFTLATLWDSALVYIEPCPKEREKEKKDDRERQPQTAPAASQALKVTKHHSERYGAFQAKYLELSN